MWHTIGHSRQKQHLERVLERGSLSHAYLFSGPAKVGKRTLALEFADKILGAEGAADGTPGTAVQHPDLLVYNDQLQHTSIASMRELSSKLSLKPYAGSYIVAIIDNFESIGTEAANSILKTLEEPNASVVLILITSNRSALLPTIVSRTQLVNFGRLADGDLPAAPAGEHDASLDELKSEALPARILAVKKFAELESDELSAMFQTWLNRERSAMVHGSPELYKNIQLLTGGIEQLTQNVNRKLILEKIFMNMVTQK